MSIPSILIVGRPNVGKSTFFNKVTKSRKAIVHDHPGVTRDLNSSYCTWEDHRFILIDSGGIYFEGKLENIQATIEENIKITIEDSDLILFLVDTKEGLHPYDKVIKKILLPYKSKVIVVANKTDSDALEVSTSEFYKLGLEYFVSISSLQKIRFNTLFETIFDILPDSKQGFNKLPYKNSIPVSILGRPNVGKSSLLNSLTGTNRSLVSDIPGTTRDSVNETIKWHEKHFTFVDTAGIKRRIKHTSDKIDYYSYIRTLKSLTDSQVALFLLDATELGTDQDKHIGNMIEEYGKGLIIVVNKWDLVKKDSSTIQHYIERIYKTFNYINYAPIIFISSLTRQRVGQLFELIESTYHEQNKRITTGQLNKFLKQWRFSSIGLAQTHGKIYYISQVDTAPPVFVVFVNKKNHFKENFKRHFSRQLRETFGFIGTPIKLKFKEKLI